MQPSSVIALGFFDGVHLGHMALLRTVRQRADALGLPAVALSFDTHPDALVRRTAVPLLSTTAQRERLLRAEGHMDEVRFLHFDEEFMNMPWQTFLDEILIGQFGARHLVCGYDYRFGAGGAGTAELLAKACAERGLGCDIVDKVELDGITVSSSAAAAPRKSSRTRRRANSPATSPAPRSRRRCAVCSWKSPRRPR